MSRHLCATAVCLLAGSVFATPPDRSNLSSSGPQLGVPISGPRGAAYTTSLDPLTGPRVYQATPTISELRITDRYELIVFAKHRPIRIRVHAAVEGSPLTTRWHNALKAAFTHFDRDSDGYLNGHEVRHIFSDTSLATLMQSGYYAPTPQDRPSLDRLDRNGDRRVAFPEFVIYYKQASAVVLRGNAPMPENQSNAYVTEALFKFLDRNSDGKLTQDELSNLEALIPSRDSDEDECLSIVELIPNFGQPQFRGGQVVQVPQQPQPPTATSSEPVMALYEINTIPGLATQRILADYDKNHDNTLTPDEIAFDLATFARLDTNRDARITADELDHWRSGPADIEVALTLSSTPANCQATVTTDSKQIQLAGFSVRQVDPSRVVIVSGRQTIDLWAFTADPRYTRVNLKQQYGQLFQFTAGAKGYVEEKDLSGQNVAQTQFIRFAFEPADHNGDGKLTRDEFDLYMDLQQSFVNLGTILTPTFQTPSLFQLLDENRDGRLGVRELRTAWPRLSALDPDSTTEITRSIFQPGVSLWLTRTLDRGLPQQVAVVNGGNPNPMATAPPQRGPTWFRKMDRNGDGDLSRTEFLGTPSEFDAIDTNHDNLISVDEAEAFDKKARE